MKDIDNLRDHYRRRLLNLHAVTITFVAVLEIVAYFIFCYLGVEKLSASSPYLWWFVALPIFLNLCAHLFARRIDSSLAYNHDLKNNVIIYAVLLTAIVIAVFHRYYIVTATDFTFPIVLCAMFNSKDLLKKVFAISLVVLIIITIMDGAFKLRQLTLSINLLVVYGVNIISYLSSLLAINFSQSNFKLIAEQAEENEQLQDKLQRDPMTGLLNHETFYEELGEAFDDYHNNSIEFTVAVLDIDDFKNINDTYGHEAGDIVLKTLARILKKHCDFNDKVCRYGGEEFAVVFDGNTEAEAVAVMEAVLGQFSSWNFKFADVSITFSCGIVQYDGITQRDELFNRADKLLYEAKQSGKNKICVGSVAKK